MQRVARLPGMSTPRPPLRKASTCSPIWAAIPIASASPTAACCASHRRCRHLSHQGRGTKDPLPRRVSSPLRATRVARRIPQDPARRAVCTSRQGTARRGSCSSRCRPGRATRSVDLATAPRGADGTQRGGLPAVRRPPRLRAACPLARPTDGGCVITRLSPLGVPPCSFALGVRRTSPSQSALSSHNRAPYRPPQPSVLPPALVADLRAQ